MIIVVCGYPGAGKTTYARQHKKYNDVVLDLDLIYEAITCNKMHNELRPKNIIQYINDLIKATIYKANEYNFDIWLVRCMPDEIENDILKEHRAKCIWLNVDRYECKKRLYKDNRLLKDFDFICNRIDNERKRLWNNNPPSFLI